MKAHDKKIFAFLFSTLFLTTYYSPIHSFHFGLDADIDFEKELEEFERGMKKINAHLDNSFKSFWGEPQASQAPAPQQGATFSLEQVWKKSGDVIKQLSKKLNTLADSMSATPPGKQTGTLRGYFDTIKSFGEHTLEQMKKTEEQISSLRKEMEHQLKNVKKARSYDVKEEFETTSYRIRVALPEFKQENINVTIDDNSRNTCKKLFVTATKDLNTQTTKTTTQKEDKEKENITHWHSETFSSTRYINGRKVGLIYKNGKLEVEIDLPEGIKDNDYTMQLENGELIISFPKTNAQSSPTTRRLEFNKENKANNNPALLK